MTWMVNSAKMPHLISCRPRVKGNQPTARRGQVAPRLHNLPWSMTHEWLYLLRLSLRCNNPLE